jgi:hypothetical protein
MIEVTTNSSSEAHESDVDAEIAAFDTWFQGRGNEALVKSERAILKTYFWFKLRAEKKDGT